MPSRAPRPPAPAIKPPVTVLCGFLGAGKTTLLNHLLSQADGRRWAAVVNDVAAINIDAAVVRRSSGTAGEIVELGNGCVCCSNRDELGETLAELAATGKFQHILVETTGVAEPRGIAELFLQKNPFGRSLSDFAQLSSLVSVVDSAQFLGEWREHQIEQKGIRFAPEAASRPVFELMVEQVECADVIVLNKCDLLKEGQGDAVERLVRGLNGRAETLRTEKSQVSVEFLLERARFDPVATIGAATWLQTMNTFSAKRKEASRGGAGSAVGPPGRDGSLVTRPKLTATAPRHETRFGIHSFVFQARRPFLRDRLERTLGRQLPGLLRAKGFFWVADQPDEMGFLSVAGGAVRYDFLNYWWAALVESGRAKRSEVPAQLEEVWQEPAGDRRQELVLIGVGIDEVDMRKQLEACLA